MNVEIYTQPFNRALGDLYVKDYIEVFPLQKEDVSLNCIDCLRKAYSKLVWYLKKTDMKKFIFSGDPKKIYNFPSIGIYGLTVENATDAICEKLYERKNPLVKLAKEKEAK